MTLSARIIRIEERMRRPGEAEKIDWQPYLGKLSDEQLSRFEELLMRMGGEEADQTPLGDRAGALDASEVIELHKIGEAMGLEW